MRIRQSMLKKLE